MTTQKPASNSDARKRLEERARSDEYTPTIVEVRNYFVRGKSEDMSAASWLDTYAAEFERWINAHDAEVAAKAKAEERERIAREIRAHRFDVWDERRSGPGSFYAGMTEAVRIARKDQP